MISGTLETKDYQHFVVRPATPPIAFEGAAHAGRAFPGDTVCWDGSTCRLEARRQQPLFLVGTLELAAKVRYGMTSRGAPLFRFSPYDAAYPPFFVGCSQKDTSKNILAKVQFDCWPEDSTCPRGLLVQTFGAAGDLAAEEASLLAHYGASRWKRGELGSLVPPALAAPAGARVGFGTFHIDPPGCRDIDDAISLFKGDDADSYEVRIHIADVASWLLSNPGLAAKAAEIGQTLYRDGGAVRPMFPAELSEGALSLLPGQPRGVLSLVLHWRAGTGFYGTPAWVRETICVDGSWTYETAAGAPWAGLLAAITGGADSHEWVERLMLLYNQEAAKALRAVGCGVLRRHGEPDRERVAAAAAAGLPVELVAYGAGEYCSAREADVRHWGLGADVYCHASSPIRRWADCINQLALFRVVLGGEPAVGVDAPTLEALKRTSAAARRYERDVAYVRAVLAVPAAAALPAVVLRDGEVWITPWRRRVRADVGDAAPGTAVLARVHHDASKRNWKGRLVVRVEKA